MPTSLPQHYPAVANLDGWSLSQLEPWSENLADRLGFIVSAYLHAMLEDRPATRDEAALLAIAKAVDGWRPAPFELSEIHVEVEGYYLGDHDPPVQRAISWLKRLSPNARRSLTEAMLVALDHGDPELSLSDRLRRMGVLLGT